MNCDFMCKLISSRGQTGPYGNPTLPNRAQTLVLFRYNPAERLLEALQEARSGSRSWWCWGLCGCTVSRFCAGQVYSEAEKIRKCLVGGPVVRGPKGCSSGEEGSGSALRPFQVSTAERDNVLEMDGVPLQPLKQSLVTRASAWVTWGVLVPPPLGSPSTDRYGDSIFSAHAN